MKYDIIIVGGGMVGATLAHALSNTSYSIAIIDAAPFDQTGKDPRLIALNHHSYQLFESLTLWDELKKFAEPVLQLHISSKGKFGITRIKAKELGFKALGYVIPAKNINEVLNGRLKKSSVQYFHETSLKNLTRNSDNIILEVSGINEPLLCDFLVGADGTNSTVRELLQISTETFDYDQSALVTKTTLQRSHDQVAYQRFQENGSIAMLPLAANQVATIWTAPKNTITELMQDNVETFLQKLQQQFGYRLGKFLEIDRRYQFSLERKIAKKQVEKNIVLLGNASHTLYPAAAQGLNLGLFEVEILGNILRTLSSLKKFEGSQYLAKVKKQQNASNFLSHHLSWVYASDSSIISLGRKFGMLGLDLFHLGKTKFAEIALGNIK